MSSLFVPFGVSCRKTEINLELTGHEQAQLEAIYAWVRGHSNDVDSEALLTRAKIDCFIMSLDQSRFIGRGLLESQSSS